jgi:hypothetical protein
MTSLLIITGTMGAGKTTVLGEASDILTQRQVIHAGIDLDALGLARLPSTSTFTSATDTDGVMYSNLRSVWENYAALGVRRCLLARALEERVQLELCREIVSASSTIVCRLTAGIETMKQRVEIRESGMSQREYVARVAKLNIILDQSKLEDFTVANENRSVTEVALEMLVKSGWISN